MPRILCIVGMVLAGVLFLLFALDAASGAVFNAGIIWDVLLLLCAGGIGWNAWTTFREQV